MTLSRNVFRAFGLYALAAALLAWPTQTEAFTPRQLEMADYHITNPWPPMDVYRGRAGLALAEYFRNTNLADANNQIHVLHDDPAFVVPDDGTQGPNAEGFKWAATMMTRIAMGVDSADYSPITDHMSAEAKADLYDIFWRYIRTRSKAANGGAANVWLGAGDSENHDVMGKGAYFLCARALLLAGPPYGPGQSRNVLADGKTLQEHYDAWNAYWKEYFYQRASAGIMVEQATPYNQYTIPTYYNIADLSGDTVTSDQARKFLDLFWADTAQNYSIGAQCRTTAGTRQYQVASDMVATRDPLRAWAYINYWHDSFIGNGNTDIIAVTSPYHVPDLVTAIATNENDHKTNDNPYGSYEYVSHRWGRVSTSNPEQTVFPSYMLRTVYWTPDYVMGAVTYDDGHQAYSDVSSQNRYSAVVFNTGIDDRIFIQGLGTDDGGRRDYEGITSYCHRNVMVVARSIGNTGNNGVRLFFPNGPLRTNLTTQGGWTFTYAGNGYFGVRVATGGYSWNTTYSPDGQLMVLTDKWSPLVIQCGRQGSGNPGPGGSSATYASFADFKNQVAGGGGYTANIFTYTGSPNYEMRYVSEAGDDFKMRKQNYSSGALPTLNGSAPNLNPVQIYNSPYIGNLWDVPSCILVGYPGYDFLVLNFDY